MIAAAFLASGIALLGLASVLVQVAATRSRRADARTNHMNRSTT